MSGREFVEALKRIGYPAADHLDGCNYDWLFDCEAVVPFLTWFCSELQPANVIACEELEEYRALETAKSKQGASGLLTGDKLEDALRQWSLIDNSIGLASEADLARSRDELSLRRGCRDELKLLHDRLMLHHAAVSDRLARLDASMNLIRSEYQHSCEQTRLDSTNMNKALEALLMVVVELLNIYKSSGQQQRHFLMSNTNMEEYHSAEERFTHELVAFTKKQFDGIGEIAGHLEGSDNELVEISNPDLLLVKGSSEDVILEACKDLTHIQSLYPISEVKRIDALIEERNTAAACEFQERLIRALKDNPLPSDQQNLSARLKEAQASLASLNRDMLQLTDVQIPSLIKDAASLQAVKILRGDYDLKIARQDYFTSNQDQVINELVIQRSRNEFLTMTLELEARSHRQVHKLLTAISVLLRKMSASFNDRMKMMNELESTFAKTNRTTVDSRNKVLHSIHQLLSDETSDDIERTKKSLFVTYSQIEQKIEKFGHETAASRAHLSTTNQVEFDRLALLDQELTKCDSVLYADSSTSGGQPSLSPRPVLETITQLDSLLKKLEQVVMDVIKDIDNKKKVLQKDPLLKTERELFSYFFNDPSRLRHSVRDIESRVQAHVAI